MCGEMERERVDGQHTELAADWVTNGEATHKAGKGNDGWNLVQRRKKKGQGVFRSRMDVAATGYRNLKGTISFFFSNFPDSHGAKEMLRAFALYGKVVEVVIPPKRNKWGKRFGFARFVDVQDPRVFVVKLDKIIFGADKIHVNLPRFERELYEDKKRTVDGKMNGEPKGSDKQNRGLELMKRQRMIWKEKSIEKGVEQHGGVVPSQQLQEGISNNNSGGVQATEGKGGVRLPNNQLQAGRIYTSRRVQANGGNGGTGGIMLEGMLMEDGRIGYKIQVKGIQIKGLSIT